jgi:hypothetical protein
MIVYILINTVANIMSNTQMCNIGRQTASHTDPTSVQEGTMMTEGTAQIVRPPQRRSLPRAILRAMRGVMKSGVALVTITAFCVTTLTAAAMALSAGFFSIVSSAIEAVYDGNTVRKTQAAVHQRRVAALSTELAENKRKLGNQAAEMNKLKEGQKVTEKRVSSLNTELSETKRKLGNQTAELNKLKAGQTVTYNGKQRPLKEVVSETSSKVRKIATKGAIRNLASMPAEGIPLLGVTVIVASTAMEVSDACNISQSMHDLDVAMNPDRAITDRPEACGLRVPSKDEVWEVIQRSPGAAWQAAKEQYEELPSWDDATQTIGAVGEQIANIASEYYAELPSGTEVIETMGVVREKAFGGVSAAWEGLWE